MQGLRSRAGIVALTAGAFALFSVPVVALAKGPPDVVGGGPKTATTVVAPQANVPDPPPGQLNKPDPAPRGHAKAPGQASTPAPAVEAPPAGTPGSSRANPPARRGPKAGTPPRPHNGQPPGHAKRGPDSEAARGSSELGGAANQPSPAGSPDERSSSGSPRQPDPTGALELPSADAPNDDDGGVAAAVVRDTVELPDDASPETLPFTGLQLALIALAGLAAVAAGLTLRRSAAT
jgi:hypothetical protein